MADILILRRASNINSTRLPLRREEIREYPKKDEDNERIEIDENTIEKLEKSINTGPETSSNDIIVDKQTIPNNSVKKQESLINNLVNNVGTSILFKNFKKCENDNNIEPFKKNEKVILLNNLNIYKKYTDDDFFSKGHKYFDKKFDINQQVLIVGKVLKHSCYKNEIIGFVYLFEYTVQIIGFYVKNLPKIQRFIPIKISEEKGKKEHILTVYYDINGKVLDSEIQSLKVFISKNIKTSNQDESIENTRKSKESKRSRRVTIGGKKNKTKKNRRYQ